MCSQWSCSTRGDKDFKKVFGFLKSQLSYTYDETNKVLSPRSGVAVKRKVVFDTCSLFRNVPSIWTHTTETTSLSKSWKKSLTAIPVSVSILCYMLSVMLQSNRELGWLFVEVPRSHTDTDTCGIKQYVFSVCVCTLNYPAR